MHNSITDVPGVMVGHAQNDEALTGCTVILCEGGAVGGVDQRGGAPGTRETELLRPMHLVEKVHAIVLTGGSAFGLDAASGVMRYLEERGVGYAVGVARVPIVPAAVIFDLAIGRSDVRPDATMGYQACINATDGALAAGNVGVGTGATVGKILGMGQAMKSGVGTASMEIGGGVIVGAIVAVNAFGDVIDPGTNRLIAGARTEFGFADTLKIMRAFAGKSARETAVTNTVIGVVATNAALNKEHINTVAQMAHDGLARTIRPAHTLFDGDTVFTLSTGKIEADVNVIGALAAEVFAQAIVRGVRAAKSAGGLPGLGDRD
jgi:L-aminopeptidase/D-esterase-like protein